MSAPVSCAAHFLQKHETEVNDLQHDFCFFSIALLFMPSLFHCMILQEHETEVDDLRTEVGQLNATVEAQSQAYAEVDALKQVRLDGSQ